MTITLKELSRLLGLSQTTVSRALNGYPEVNETTRARVMKAAQDHQYTPNPRARSLATGRAHVIGHVLPLLGHSEMVNPVFADFLSGAGAVYTRRGYGVHLSFPEPGNEADHYRWLTRQRMVDGVVVHSPRADDERLRILSGLGLNFGVHGQIASGPCDYNFVDMDNFAALTIATRHLVDLGHERIAMLNAPPGLAFSLRREDGFLTVMEAAGLVPNRLWMHNEDMTEAYGYRVAHRLLGGKIPPTAFLTGSVLVAMGVRRAVLERGLSVPDHVSIVTHDDVLSYLPNDTTPPLFTATRSPIHKAGALLAEILINQIEGHQTMPRGEILQPEFIQGQSSGPVRTLAPSHA